MTKFSDAALWNEFVAVLKSAGISGDNIYNFIRNPDTRKLVIDILQHVKHPTDAPVLSPDAIAKLATAINRPDGSGMSFDVSEHPQSILLAFQKLNQYGQDMLTFAFDLYDLEVESRVCLLAKELGSRLDFSEWGEIERALNYLRDFLRDDHYDNRKLFKKHELKMLGLPPRLEEYLLSRGYNTVRKLLSRTAAELSSWYRLSPDWIKIVEHKLAIHNFSLKN